MGWSPPGDGYTSQSRRELEKAGDGRAGGQAGEMGAAREEQGGKQQTEKRTEGSRGKKLEQRRVEVRTGGSRAEGAVEHSRTGQGREHVTAGQARRSLQQRWADGRLWHRNDQGKVLEIRTWTRKTKQKSYRRSEQTNPNSPNIIQSSFETLQP